MKQSKSALGLKARLQKSSVRDETRTKEAQAPGGGSLPAGMSGVAKLTRLDFDVMESGDYAGEQRLYAHGVCVSPKTFKDSDGNVHNTQGVLVQLSKINLCDTKNRDGSVVSFEENWSRAENRLKLLGIPTEDMEDSDIEDEVLSYVKSEEIYFRFRTWKPEDSDRVNVTLEGPTHFDQDGGSSSEDDVEDDTEEAPKPKATKEEKKSKTEPPKKQPTAKEEKKVTAASPKKQEASSSEELSAKDIKKLGEEGDSGDEESQVVLTDMADNAGIDTTDYKDWSDVAEAIINSKKGAKSSSKKDTVQEEEEDQDDSSDSDEDSQAEEEGNAPEYEKGDIVTYKKKDHEIIGVFPAKGVVTLKDLESGKLLKSIPVEMIRQS